MSRIKTVLVPIAAALLSGFVCFSGGWQTGYDEGQAAKAAERSAYSYTADDMTGQYNTGYKSGYSDGKTVGYKSGYLDGKAVGRQMQIASETSKPSSQTNSQQFDIKPYTQDNSQSVTVYVTNTGSKYHRKGCQYLRQSCIAISLSAAKNQGYTACSKCF